MITSTGFSSVSTLIGVPIPEIKAIAEVESNGSGFLPTGEPVILYEPYKFSKHTKGKFDRHTVTIGGGKCYPLSLSGAWGRTKAMYGSSSIQHQKLTAASALDRDAALMSCSWGKFQIMGEHWKVLGYPTLQEFINQMYKDEDAHLDAFGRFIKVNHLAVELKNHTEKFFDRYNGSSWRQNNYRNKFLTALKKYQ